MTSCKFSHQPPARVGRDHQRYSVSGVRLVAGCVPYRITDGHPTEILLITNQKKNRWIIPKGGWEKDESEVEAAAREAYEEAGVEGVLGECLVDHEYMGKSGPQRHRYFALKVERTLDEWPEESRRMRKWVSIEDAAQECKREGMHEAILALSVKLKEAQRIAVSASPTLSTATSSASTTPILTPKRVCRLEDGDQSQGEQPNQPQKQVEEQQVQQEKQKKQDAPELSKRAEQLPTQA